MNRYISLATWAHKYSSVLLGVAFVILTGSIAGSFVWFFLIDGYTTEVYLTFFTASLHQLFFLVYGERISIIWGEIALQVT